MTSKTDRRYTDTTGKIAELLDKGMSVLEISRLLTISPQAVYRQIERHDLDLPTQREAS